jgi:EpsI family protein
MACFALLFLEMWVLVRTTGDKRQFRDIFAVEFPPPRPQAAPTQPREWVKPAIAALVVLLLMVYPVTSLPERVELKPVRPEFVDFPLSVGAWVGTREQMDAIYLDALKLDDYVMANYVKGDLGAVNFYAAYYASQRTGRSAHSPSSCLPGNGWRMEDFGQRAIPGVEAGGQPLHVNRTVIKKGDDAQLVYYWFQQRGRGLTNEYLVKWFIFWDALTRNRTDGALVRLVTPVPAGEDIAKADERLMDFVRHATPLLTKFVPD